MNKPSSHDPPKEKKTGSKPKKPSPKAPSHLKVGAPKIKSVVKTSPRPIHLTGWGDGTEENFADAKYHLSPSDREEESKLDPLEVSMHSNVSNNYQESEGNKSLVDTKEGDESFTASKHEDPKKRIHDEFPEVNQVTFPLLGEEVNTTKTEQTSKKSRSTPENIQNLAKGDKLEEEEEKIDQMLEGTKSHSNENLLLLGEKQRQSPESGKENKKEEAICEEIEEAYIPPDYKNNNNKEETDKASSAHKHENQEEEKEEQIPLEEKGQKSVGFSEANTAVHVNKVIEEEVVTQKEEHSVHHESDKSHGNFADKKENNEIISAEEEEKETDIKGDENLNNQEEKFDDNNPAQEEAYTEQNDSHVPANDLKDNLESHKLKENQQAASSNENEHIQNLLEESKEDREEEIPPRNQEGSNSEGKSNHQETNLDDQHSKGTGDQKVKGFDEGNVTHEKENITNEELIKNHGTLAENKEEPFDPEEKSTEILNDKPLDQDKGLESREEEAYDPQEEQKVHEEPTVHGEHGEPKLDHVEQMDVSEVQQNVSEENLNNQMEETFEPEANSLEKEEKDKKAERQPANENVQDEEKEEEKTEQHEEKEHTQDNANNVESKEEPEPEINEEEKYEETPTTEKESKNREEGIKENKEEGAGEPREDTVENIETGTKGEEKYCYEQDSEEIVMPIRPEHREEKIKCKVQNNFEEEKEPNVIPTEANADHLKGHAESNNLTDILENKRTSEEVEETKEAREDLKEDQFPGESTEEKREEATLNKVEENVEDKLENDTNIEVCQSKDKENVNKEDDKLENDTNIEVCQSKDKENVSKEDEVPAILEPAKNDNQNESPFEKQTLVTENANLGKVMDPVSIIQEAEVNIKSKPENVPLAESSQEIQSKNPVAALPKDKKINDTQNEADPKASSKNAPKQEKTSLLGFDFSSLKNKITSFSSKINEKMEDKEIEALSTKKFATPSERFDHFEKIFEKANGYLNKKKPEVALEMMSIAMEQVHPFHFKDSTDLLKNSLDKIAKGCEKIIDICMEIEDYELAVNYADTYLGINPNDFQVVFKKSKCYALSKKEKESNLLVKDAYELMSAQPTDRHVPEIISAYQAINPEHIAPKITKQKQEVEDLTMNLVVPTVAGVFGFGLSKLLFKFSNKGGFISGLTAAIGASLVLETVKPKTKKKE